jgi:hypothetical protein
MHHEKKLKSQRQSNSHLLKAVETIAAANSASRNEPTADEFEFGTNRWLLNKINAQK